MNFKVLCEYFSRLEEISSRLAMTEILAKLFREVSVEEIGPVVNLSLGQLQPKFNRLEFNLAEKMVFRAIGEAVGWGLMDVVKTYKQVGDIGVTVERFKIKDLRFKKLLVGQVYEKLVALARDNGVGSQERKVTALAELLDELEPVSAKYVARMIVGKLRLGFSDMTILDALSWMERGDKSGRAALEDAYQLSPDIAKIARLAKEKGIDAGSKSVEVELGIPVIPALAQRLKTADEMIKKMGKVSVDPKYDGTRVQIHYRSTKSTKGVIAEDWHVRTFTRNLDETSYMFPEMEHVAKYIKADEVILDAEAVGYDPATGRLLSFQQTIQRKRKHGIEETAKSIPLKFFVFDILYKNGKSLVQKPLSERYEILKNTVVDGPILEKTEFIVTESAEEVRKQHADFLAQGLEGAMVKKWYGIYKPGRKGWGWVKFKEAEGSAAKLSDTIDAVVMGLYLGRGKRTEFGVGAFLVGILANENSQKSNVKTQNEFVEGQIYTISKVGTGLSDEQWKELKTRSQALVARSRPKEYVVDKNLEPDIWLSPDLVVEIAADEVTKSPIHSAGLALRFPRLIRFRDDKATSETTCVEEMLAMV